MVTSTATLGLRHCWRCTMLTPSDPTPTLSNKPNGVIKIGRTREDITVTLRATSVEITVPCRRCGQDNTYSYSLTAVDNSKT